MSNSTIIICFLVPTPHIPSYRGAWGRSIMHYALNYALNYALYAFHSWLNTYR